MSTPTNHESRLLVVFSHGKESGPNGRKIEALAAIAQDMGAATLSVNYREYPLGVAHDHDRPGEPERRVAQLLGTPLPEHDRLVLVGSSMGGYVSAVAASRLRVDGLFLLAPAISMPGYADQQPAAPARRCTIVHGWQDELIPWERVARWAGQDGGRTLHLLPGDHRLDGALPQIEPLFRLFLTGLNF